MAVKLAFLFKERSLSGSTDYRVVDSEGSRICTYDPADVSVDEIVDMVAR